MRRRKQALKRSSSAPTRYGRRAVICAVVILGIGSFLFFGRGIMAWSARRMAAHQMNVGAISTSQRWLTWSAWFDSDNGGTQLMQAACFRRLEQAGWREALQLAEQNGAPAAKIDQEQRLGAIQSGQVTEDVESEMVALLEAGVPPHEVCTAVVQGYLAHEAPEKAKALLEAWARDHPGDANLAYMAGIRWRWLGDRANAEREFRNAVASQPQHELARMALAQLLEEQHRLDEALEQCVELAARFPANEPALSSLARLLRKQGRLDEARTVLKPLISRPDPPLVVVAEMALIEFESGSYEKAERWFERADFEQTEDDNVLAAAANTLALSGQIPRADGLFVRVDTAHSNAARTSELAVRLALNPTDMELARQWRRASQASTSSGAQPVAEVRQGESAMSGPELYAFYCSACHGANGDGSGRAARHLFPRPRDLRRDKSRLVSALNGVPTLEDLDAVIRRGMPGTAMPAFDYLSEEQQRLLSQEVLRLNREGIREQFVEQLRDEEEPIDEDEVRDVVEFCTTPGELATVPPIGPADSQVIARGKEAYSTLGCNKCHGDDGTGTFDTPLFDDKGRPTIPRDLVHDPFKGGHEPNSIYLRILLGMPGTPHPACYNVSKDQLVDLVHYCRSLAQEPKRKRTNHQRAIQVAQQAYSMALDESSGP
jgi:Flp pilus assembly protein TadD/mono/diheme cytochrome c family protein